jgi:hypothetical protein
VGAIGKHQDNDMKKMSITETRGSSKEDEPRRYVAVLSTNNPIPAEYFPTLSSL